MISFEDSNILREKIAYLEQQIVDLQEVSMTLSESLRDTQRFVIQLSQNEILIAKQIAQWPYVLVEDSAPKRKRNSKPSKPNNTKEPPEQQD